MKYVDAKVVFQEIPDEITLAISISGCTIHCAGCHSKYLWDDIGELLTIDSLKQLIEKNSGITCVCFMGGDSNPVLIAQFAYFIKSNYPSLKVAWYSGKEALIDGFEEVLPYFEYIKLGPYKQECGGLDNPNTNQKLFGIVNVDGFYRMVDITYKFWKTKQ